MTDTYSESFERYPRVPEGQLEKSPGSTADFAGSLGMQLRFSELSAEFKRVHRYIEPERPLTAPATAEVVEASSAQVPTPEA